MTSAHDADEARSDFVIHLGPQGLVVVTYLARQDIDEELARLETV